MSYEECIGCKYLQHNSGAEVPYDCIFPKFYSLAMSRGFGIEAPCGDGWRTVGLVEINPCDYDDRFDDSRCTVRKGRDGTVWIMIITVKENHRREGVFTLFLKRMIDSHERIIICDYGQIVKHTALKLGFRENDGKLVYES